MNTEALRARADWLLGVHERAVARYAALEADPTIAPEVLKSSKVRVLKTSQTLSLAQWNLRIATSDTRALDPGESIETRNGVLWLGTDSHRVGKKDYTTLDQSLRINYDTFEGTGAWSLMERGADQMWQLASGSLRECFAAAAAVLAAAATDKEEQ